MQRNWFSAKLPDTHIYIYTSTYVYIYMYIYIWGRSKLFCLQLEALSGGHTPCLLDPILVPMGLDKFWSKDQKVTGRELNPALFEDDICGICTYIYLSIYLSMVIYG